MAPTVLVRIAPECAARVTCGYFNPRATFRVSRYICLRTQVAGLIMQGARMPRQGSTNDRGYGAAHQRLRATLLAGAYGHKCPKCGEVMEHGQPLDLGHTTDRSGYTGMEHRSCNRSHGATIGNSRRNGVAASADKAKVVNVDVNDL